MSDRRLVRLGRPIDGRPAGQLVHLDAFDLPLQELVLLADLERHLGRLRRAEGGPTGCLVPTTGNRVDAVGPEGCYRRVRVGGESHAFHRVVVAVTLGRQPSGPVLHACDRKACVAPSHLSVGTAAENSRQAYERGLGPRGQAHPRARLRDQEVIDARRRVRAGGSTLRQEADRYGVTDVVMRRALTGASYANVDEPSCDLLTRRRLTNCGVGVLRLLVAAGCQPSAAAAATGLSGAYVRAIVTGGRRAEAGGPLSTLGHPMGRKASNVKLTDDAVTAIRQAARHHVPRRELAHRFGIERSTVDRIVTYKTWRHLP